MGGLLETACFLLPQRRQRILASYYSTLLSSPLPACRIAGVGDIGFLHAPFALTWTCVWLTLHSNISVPDNFNRLPPLANSVPFLQTPISLRSPRS